MSRCCVWERKVCVCLLLRPLWGVSLCCVSFLSTARMSSDYQNTLPYSQQTAQLAAACAANWKRNAVNAMTLKENLKAADADGDGTIDKDEFQQLVALAGAQGLTFEMVDKDGDGEITEEELQKLQDTQRGKVKARGNI